MEDLLQSWFNPSFYTTVGFLLLNCHRIGNDKGAVNAIGPTFFVAKRQVVKLNLARLSS